MVSSYFAVRTGLDLRSLMRQSRITLARRGTGESLIRLATIKKETLMVSSYVAVRTGLEPVTPCVTGMYSNQAELTHQKEHEKTERQTRLELATLTLARLCSTN